MIHPLLRLMASRPQLLADHAHAYAGLVSEEISRAVIGVKQRVILVAIAFGLIALSAILAGVALMLWAVIPRVDIQAPWALIAAPGVPGLIAAVCLVVGRGEPEAAFAELKKQVDADLSMLREARTT